MKGRFGDWHLDIHGGGQSQIPRTNNKYSLQVRPENELGLSFTLLRQWIVHFNMVSLKVA